MYSTHAHTKIYILTARTRTNVVSAKMPKTGTPKRKPPTTSKRTIANEATEGPVQIC